MLKKFVVPLLAAMIAAGLAPMSIAKTVSPSKFSDSVQAADTRATLERRFSRLRRGINLSHWFAQSITNNYSKTHLESHTTVDDLALIESMGFDHVRFTIEPTPLFDEWDDPGKLKSEYLKLFDAALDLILARKLAVIVDIHPHDEFKVRLNKEDRHVEAFAKFWTSFAKHLSTRDPERVFLETINEPMVEDSYRWQGIQAKLISAIRLGAPRHTIIASGYRWSGLYDLLALETFSDGNVIYNFHFYEPFAFTHQGASWAGPNLPFYKNVPYPSSPESIAKVLDSVADEPARYNLLRYGEERWNIDRLDREIAVAATWAAKRGVLLTCNEFGTFRRFVTPADRLAWINDLRTVLEKHGIGWAMWDYAGGFSVVDKVDGRAKPDESVLKALGLRK
jgi:endoglucanase